MSFTHCIYPALLACLLSVPAYAADVKAGARIFASTCFGCHPGGGNVLNPAKPLKGAAFKKAFPTDQAIASIVRTGIPKTVMTPFTKQRLSDEQLSDIIAYIKTLTPKAPACPPGQPSKGGGSGKAAAKSNCKNGRPGRLHTP